MIIPKNSYYEEDERLFSTGDPDLDDILEEVYYSGISDGYDYFELEQREFARNKHNKTNAVKAGTEKAVAQGKKAILDSNRLDEVAKEIAEKHNGDIDAFLKSLKETNNFNRYKAYKSRFSSGQGRADLEKVLGGMKATDASTVKKAARGVEANLNQAGDATAALGKTRKSVQEAGGLTREAGGKKINMQLDQNGRALIVAEPTNATQGTQRAIAVTKENAGRAATVNREVAMPQPGGTVGARRRGSIPAKYRKKNPNAYPTINTQQQLGMSVAPNQVFAGTSALAKGGDIGKVSKAVIGNGQVTPNSFVAVQNHTNPRDPINSFKTPVAEVPAPATPAPAGSAPKTRKPRSTGGGGSRAASSSKKAATTTGGKVKGFLGKNKKALLIGTGVLGAGAVAGAALSNRNKRQQ